jgi:hypothetical protein
LGSALQQAQNADPRPGRIGSRAVPVIGQPSGNSAQREASSVSVRIANRLGFARSNSGENAQRHAVGTRHVGGGEFNARIHDRGDEAN